MNKKLKNLTFLIVTFLRDEYFYKCVESIREQYGDVKIIAGDNGYPSEEKKEFCKRYDVEYYDLPFDCGLCQSRNFLVNRVNTDYLVIGDDDFYYTEEAKVDLMLDELKRSDFDLISGRISEGGVVRNYQGFIERGKGYIKYSKLDEGLLNSDTPIEVDIAFNYFLARTKAVKKTKWDEKIKVAYEHSSFFMDFKENGFKIGLLPKATVAHKPSINIRDKTKYTDYRDYRSRKNDKKRFFEKYKLNYAIDMNGKRDVYDGTGIDEIAFCITHFERKECLEALLFSIVKYYPQAKIYIADQSKKFIISYYQDLWKKLFEAGIKTKPKAWNVPHDYGVSASRNLLVERTQERYVLILEDDFVFTKNTKIEKMKDLLDAKINIGILGGQVKEQGFKINFEHNFKRSGKKLKHVSDGDLYMHEEGVRFKPTQSVMNFALMRRRIFEKVKWDNDLKIEGEHTDFYLCAKDENISVAFAPDIEIEHKKINSREYKEFRRRNDFLKIMMEKHNLTKIIYQNGFTILLKNGKIIKGK